MHSFFFYFFHKSRSVWMAMIHTKICSIIALNVSIVHCHNLLFVHNAMWKMLKISDTQHHNAIYAQWRYGVSVYERMNVRAMPTYIYSITFTKRPSISSFGIFRDLNFIHQNQLLFYLFLENDKHTHIQTHSNPDGANEFFYAICHSHNK